MADTLTTILLNVSQFTMLVNDVVCFFLLIMAPVRESITGNRKFSMLTFALGILPHGMPEVKDVKPAITKEEEEEEELHNKGKKKRAEEEEKKRLQELSEEEKQVSTLTFSLNILLRVSQWASDKF